MLLDSDFDAIAPATTLGTSWESRALRRAATRSYVWRQVDRDLVRAYQARILRNARTTTKPGSAARDELEISARKAAQMAVSSNY